MTPNPTPVGVTQTSLTGEGHYSEAHVTSFECHPFTVLARESNMTALCLHMNTIDLADEFQMNGK